MSVLIKPIVTEKAVGQEEIQGRYMFEVCKQANKIQIKQAVESKYNVSVIKVNTMIYPAKRTTKYTKKGIQYPVKGSYKRAIVDLAGADEIDFYSNI